MLNSLLYNSVLTLANCEVECQQKNVAIQMCSAYSDIGGVGLSMIFGKPHTYRCQKLQDLPDCHIGSHQPDNTQMPDFL